MSVDGAVADHVESQSNDAFYPRTARDRCLEYTSGEAELVRIEPSWQRTRGVFSELKS